MLIKVINKVNRLICGIILLFITSFVLASNNFYSLGANDFRSPDQVFKVTLDQESSPIKVNIDIAPNFYIYKDRFKLYSEPQGLIDQNAIKIPNGFKTKIFDGESDVFENVLTGKFSISVPLAKRKSGNLVVILQGCDGKTVCYPPQKYVMPINVDIPWYDGIIQLIKDIYNGNSNGYNSQLGLLQIFLVFFIAGISLSLTPCTYPLYPIALSALTGNSANRNNIVKLTLCYIHGISLIYVVLGIIAAYTGKFMITIIQNTVFVFCSVLILILLALAMLDLLEFKLPTGINNYITIKTNNIVGGRYTSAFLLGVLSSLLLGPCVTPPLIIAIGFVANAQSVLIGVLGLYGLSLGICLPIFILATIGTRVLPKSGGWLVLMKHFLGIIILGIAIKLAYPFLNFGSPVLSIGILCFIITFIMLLIKEFSSPDLQLLTHKVLPISMIGIGIILTILGLEQINSKTNVNIYQSDSIMKTDNISQVKKTIQNDSHQKPTIVIVSAKWCSICHELDSKTFSDKKVKLAFKDYQTIELDITNNEDQQISFLNSYKIYGPPAILIFNTRGELVEKIIGFIDSEALLAKLVKITPG